MDERAGEAISHNSKRLGVTRAVTPRRLFVNPPMFDSQVAWSSVKGVFFPKRGTTPVLPFLRRHLRAIEQCLALSYELLSQLIAKWLTVELRIF